MVGEESLFITGGSEYDDATTEYIHLNGSEDIGPDMPMPLDNHCLVKINATTAMLIGGYVFKTRSHVNNTYFYDIPTRTWSEGPGINVVRTHAACGIVRDSEDGTLMVVVAGGRNFFGNAPEIASTELWIQGANEWLIGEDLPGELRSAAGTANHLLFEADIIILVQL